MMETNAGNMNTEALGEAEKVVVEGEAQENVAPVIPVVPAQETTIGQPTEQETTTTITFPSHPVIAAVLLVAFHHKNGPQLDYAYPPLPNGNGKIQNADGSALPLPQEWSYMPFMCLPDGAHLVDEEYIYFHLPPVPSWGSFAANTMFGIACFRQISADQLLHRTADITRSKVQKAVVVLTRQPIQGSLRHKLGVVTAALFEQRDFSNLTLLPSLYESFAATVSPKITTSTLYIGLPLQEFLYFFKSKVLVILKALLLEKRIMFFGRKVDRLCTYQYCLVSLIPNLIRNLQDVGSPTLPFRPLTHADSTTLAIPTLSFTNTEDILKNNKEASMESLEDLILYESLAMPLHVFGEGALFQPYLPLQQLEQIVQSPASPTKSFIVGTSNAVLTQHKSLGIDVLINLDEATVEIVNESCKKQLELTACDRKFMDDITKLVMANYTPPPPSVTGIQAHVTGAGSLTTGIPPPIPHDPSTMEMRFEGSDDDIRHRFENYVFRLLGTTKVFGEVLRSTAKLGSNPSGGATGSVTMSPPTEQPSAAERRNSTHSVTKSTKSNNSTTNAAGAGEESSTNSVGSLPSGPALVLMNGVSVSIDDPEKAKQTLSEFNTTFIKSWMTQTKNYKAWVSALQPEQDILDFVELGHPFSGASVFSEFSEKVSGKIQELNLDTARASWNKVFSSAESKLSKYYGDWKVQQQQAQQAQQQQQQQSTATVASEKSGEGNSQQQDGSAPALNKKISTFFSGMMKGGNTEGINNAEVKALPTTPTQTTPTATAQPKEDTTNENTNKTVQELSQKAAEIKGVASKKASALFASASVWLAKKRAELNTDEPEIAEGDEQKDVPPPPAPSEK